MQSTSPKQTNKERISLTINRKLYEQFRKVSKKELRPKSAIVENAIGRYVNSRV
jgi:metal-responsive CopG/Arc/MetJ family transcriptional regulator